MPSGSLNDALVKPEIDNPTGGFGVRVADIENDIDVNNYMLPQPQALDCLYHHFTFNSSENLEAEARRCSAYTPEA